MSKILITSIACMLVATVRGQDFYNLNFAQKCDTSKTGLCYWDLSWGQKNAVTPAFIENKSAIAIEGKSEGSVGFAEQTSLLKHATGVRVLSLSALIKSEDVHGKGAGLNIGLYDSSGALVATKDMGGFYSVNWIQGTNTWKKYTVSLVCPAETRKIKIGVILFGKGKVWFTGLNMKNADINNRKPSKLALRYIATVCDTIRINSLVRDSININQLKETALKIAGPAKTYSDCFLAVNFLLESLRPYGDLHSFFMSANEVTNWENEGSQVSKIEFPSYQVINNCGYIHVPPFHGGNPKQMTAYADSIQGAIKKLSNTNIKGWVIDLRQNTGGNMEPMIAGLGPLFSSKKLGSLIDVNGKPGAWYYNDGRYYGDNYEGWTVTHPVTLASHLPIAVLTSDQTGSSGEIVVISFIANENTKSFGQPTWGLTTGNGSFELMDGSQVFLASTIMADRNGNKYETRIQPDYLVENIPATENDEIMDEAIKWILSFK